MSIEILKDIILNFNLDAFKRFFRSKSDKFRPSNESFEYEKDKFTNGRKLGEIEFEDGFLIIYAFKVKQLLSERAGKKAQYELGKKILRETQSDAGIFIFYDDFSRFRFSLIYANYLGRRRDWSSFRRFTYFVSKELTNKTFLQRIGGGDFSSLEKIKEAFSVEKVTKEFYQDIANWYFWAVENCRFPNGAEKEKGGRNIAIIRLITRMIFVWFMRELNLVPKELFEEGEIQKILKDTNPESSTYYRAILQNLFFATLSTPQNERHFRDERRFNKGYNKDFGNQYVFRYHSLFREPEKIKDYFNNIPFLNGGLFECLDDSENDIYVDGFTERKRYQPHIPNFLFFSPEREFDLNKIYGTKDKRYKVRGLLNILSSFNFTIDENSLDDAEIALDPELLGKVFENLLASFNPETATTARKATGSYYTPREIVDYMVTESLKEYFKTHLNDVQDIDKKLEILFDKSNNQNPFNNSESERLVGLIENVRIVDPAVGSGSFPMGALNKMVFILNKVDPQNRFWKEAQLKAADAIPDPRVRQNTKEQIENFFQSKNADYGRKLYLIQKCIYGVDIQPIAVEIAKLRFFISLLVDEKIDKEKKNWGIEPLPNLDFKIMQGDSLISEFLGINFDNGQTKGGQAAILSTEEDELIREFERKKFDFQNEPDKGKKKNLKNEIENLIIKIFETKIRKQKADYFRQLDEIEKKYSSLPNQKTREEIITQEKQKLSQTTGFDLERIEKQLREFTSKSKAKPFFPWKLYFAEVFEKGGFDIVIGNPPYIQLQKSVDKGGKKYADLYKDQGYETFGRTGDIYCLFYERGLNLLKEGGHLCYISSNKWMRAAYGELLRKYFTKYNPKILIDLGPDVFESSTVNTNILLIQKSRAGLQNGSSVFSLKAVKISKRDGIDLQRQLKENGVILTNLTKDAWFIGSDAEQRLKEKIERIGKPLKDWDVKICYGIKTGLNEAFIITTEKRNEILANCKDEEERKRTEAIIKPILRGRDIKRYSYEWPGLWVILAKFGFYKEAYLYPAVVNYLKKFENKLKNRGQCKYTRSGKSLSSDYDGQHHWLELDNNPTDNYLAEFEKEKVVYSEIVREPQFYYDTEKFYVEATSFLMTGEKLKYICGLLNSKPVSYFFKKWYSGGGLGDEGYRYKKAFLGNLPLPIPPSSNINIVKQIEDLVDKILQAKKQNPRANTTEFEKQIDQLVYKLYGLTEEEIKILENHERI